MAITVHYVTSWGFAEFTIYLVIENGKGFLVNFYNNSFGYICPCCMKDIHRTEIKKIIEKTIKSGGVTGKIDWCCHHHGSREVIPQDWPCPTGYFPEDYFCNGNAYNMSVGAYDALKKYASTIKF